MDEARTFSSCIPKDALTALDSINAAIVSSRSLDDMLARVLDEVLDIFDCDRAWIVYPCDPAAEDVRVVAERHRPGFDGAVAAGGKIPADPSARNFLAMCLKDQGPIRFDPLCNPPAQRDSGAMRKFHVASQLVVPLRPLDDHPWVLGLHHCREPVVYDQAVALFAAVGKRIGAGLTTLLTLKRLRESEERYRALVDHAAEAIMILDLDAAKCIDANPAAARMFGVPLDELLGNYGPVELSPEFQPDGRPSPAAAMEYVERAMQGELPSFEWMHKHRDGGEVPVQIALSRLPHPTRRLVRASLIDISETKAAERQNAALQAQLTQAQRLESIGQLTGGVAHDFNNLLSVILGNLELLSDDVGREDLRDLIDAAAKATLRGVDLTRNMLSFARRAHLEPTVLDLNAVLREMDNWMRRTLPASIALDLDLADGLGRIEADRASTESAILNLIINARDAMPEGGTLTIATRNARADRRPAGAVGDEIDAGQYVLLTVRDTGIGIPQGQIEKVFEPFFTTKGPGKGSGLGLSMVHGFMNQSGGAARLFSNPGVGTTVQLFFKMPAQANPAVAEAADEAHSGGSGAARILLAEDQVAVSEIAVRLLELAGYQVVAADSGDLAYQKFRTEGPFDLLVTDMVMPGTLQGADLAREVRQLRPDMPVVFMSGYAHDAERPGEGLRAGDIRLMKPVTRAKLLNAVEKAMRNAREVEAGRSGEF